jgi:hypothetical protein
MTAASPLDRYPSCPRAVTRDGYVGVDIEAALTRQG